MLNKNIKKPRSSHSAFHIRHLRKKNLPQMRYPENLPILAAKDEIISAIKQHSVVIISGETGSGKTTQIPKFCLEAGQGINGLIGCTQPRRIAAITVANRIAEELGEDIGKSVGYKIRFADKTAKHAYVKIMTDGILLAETRSDPKLKSYDTLIVDEAHERSLNIDFILGVLKTLVKKRKDLKLIITSATIDTEKFSKAFDDAPVIEVSGRLYPVEVRYASDRDGNAEEEETHVEAAGRAVRRILQESPYGGDILVFMPTEQDIRETCDILDGMVTELKRGSAVNILPLFARLSAAEQGRVFNKGGRRKIIVATNVAETSITIPGIKYVVDTGLARISRYSPRTRTAGLPVVPVSRSSADQRMGRCGRVTDGVCIRLYSEENYLDRPLYTPPEIVRSNLAEVILRMISLNLGDVDRFPFIDRPADKSIRDGFDLLTEIGAIVRDRQARGPSPYRLTANGKLMAQIPLDPRLSCMIIEAREQDCIKEILVIASALSIQDPRERPLEKQQEADQAHKVFIDPQSDFVTLLNIWNRYHTTLGQVKTTGKIKRFCREHFISFRRMREWRDIHAQIALIMREEWPESNQESNPKPNPIKAPALPKKTKNESSAFNIQYEKIHRCILSGFLSNIANKKEGNFVKAAKDREAMIFPGSGLFGKAGAWIVAAEMVETSRLFARINANIDVYWLESIGREQCRYTYLNPHWERKRGEVTASEQVSLYGLIIVPGRAVSFGRIDKPRAREIFIQSALVAGDVKYPMPFMQHNMDCIKQVQEMEDRFRRRDLLVSDVEIHQFYDRHIPDRVCDIRSLTRFLKDQPDDCFLRITLKDLMLYDPHEDELERFPETISIGNHTVSCAYRFEPGGKEDGVTVKLKAGHTPAITADALDWVVPGLLGEKITTLIKGLPKTYRRQLVPVTNTVEIILKHMPRTPNVPLLTALSNFINQKFGIDIPASAWPAADLPDHLKMRVAITGANGKVLAAGRDKSVLTKAVSDEPDSASFETARKKWEKLGLTEWDFGDIPEVVTLYGPQKKGRGEQREEWPVYPALKADEHCTDLLLFSNREQAIKIHREGVCKLFSLHLAKDLKFLKKQIKLLPSLKRQAAYFGGSPSVEKKIFERVVNDLFCANIRNQDDFINHAGKAAAGMLSKGDEKLKQVVKILTVYDETRCTLYDLEQANLKNPAALSLIAGLRDALSKLIPENFIALYGDERFSQLEKYMQASSIRAKRGVIDPEKDRKKAEELTPHTDSLSELLKDLSQDSSTARRQAVEEYFWMIEEYKISLFAQELKTSIPVSAKRLRQKAGEIARMV